MPPLTKIEGDTGKLQVAKAAVQAQGSLSLAGLKTPGKKQQERISPQKGRFMGLESGYLSEG